MTRSFMLMMTMILHQTEQQQKELQQMRLLTTNRNSKHFVKFLKMIEIGP